MSNFIEEVKRNIPSNTKILPSVIVAQAILESARGTSELARKANNLFGIKGNYNGQSYTVKTKEYLNGKWTTVNAAFKKYPSYRESIIDHGNFFTSTPWRTQNYQRVLNAKDYKTQAKALQACGYATDPQYANKLINLIETNNLSSLDGNNGGNSVGYTIVNMFKPSMYHINAPYAMTPKYITIHNTGNTASARNEAAYMNSNSNYTSYHVAIDDKEAVQVVPFNRNAWHAGDGQGQGNRASIGIEICYSMDNGYSGAMSARYKQAQENTALYVAYVLHQYGWGTDRLRQHWNWSGKDCPHKMRAHNGWGAFVARVQAHLNAIKGGQKATTPTKSNPTPSKSGTYTVKKGDTLFGIAKANKTTVAKIKSLNGLESDTIKVGQKLKVSGTVAKPKVSKKPQGVSEKGWSFAGTFEASETIVVRRGYKSTGAPRLHLNKPVAKGSYLKPGDFINFDHVWFADGYWWVRFKYPGRKDSNYYFVPLGVRNPAVEFSKAKLWGKLTKLSMKKGSKVLDWHKKNAIK